VIGYGSGDAVMLDVNYRSGQFAKCGQEARDIGGMLADGGFVQHVEHVFEAACQGNGQADAL
jgi:hypothetical protein